MLSFGKRSLSSYSLLLGTGNAIFHYDSQWYQQKKNQTKKPEKNPPKTQTNWKKKKKKTIGTVSKMFKNFYCYNPVSVFCSLEVQCPPALSSRYFSLETPLFTFAF